MAPDGQQRPSLCSGAAATSHPRLCFCVLRSLGVSHPLSCLFRTYSCEILPSLHAELMVSKSCCPASPPRAGASLPGSELFIFMFANRPAVSVGVTARASHPEAARTPAGRPVGVRSPCSSPWVACGGAGPCLPRGRPAVPAVCVEKSFPSPSDRPASFLKSQGVLWVASVGPTPLPALSSWFPSLPSRS